MKNLYFYQAAILPKACTLPLKMMNPVLQPVGMLFKITIKITDFCVKCTS